MNTALLTAYKMGLAVWPSGIRGNSKLERLQGSGNNLDLKLPGKKCPYVYVRVYIYIDIEREA